MSKRIYALYFQDNSNNYSTIPMCRYCLKISTSKTWERHEKELETYPSGVMKYNDCYYISFSRAQLVNKAKEIKAEWVKEAERNLEFIQNIEIK